MNRNDRLIRYNDILVVILLVLIGASLVLTGAFAARLRESSDLSAVERVSHRNQLVQLRIENRIRASRQRVLDISRSFGPDLAPADQRQLLSRLNAAPGQLPETEWYLFDAGTGRLVGEENRSAAEASLGSTDSTRSGGSALPPERPGVTLYRAGRGQTPKVAVVFSSATVIAERYHPVLSVEANALVGLLQSEVARPVSARLLNWAGNELVTADLESGGIAAMHAHWDAAGFADHEDAPPYLGVMNLHLGRSSEPRIRSSQDGIHSLIPIPDIGASIVLRDQPARQGLFFGGPAVPIVLLGLALYVLIVVLFVRYRRTVLGQTRRLNQFSEQKNLLFSLLSHNLKNNLAAVAAEAQATPGNQRVLAPVADASRTISNSLYYLQFQEGTFEPPPLEPVQIGELLEFLSLRCVAEAEAKSQALQCGTEPVEEVWIWTNLSMALEALERLLVNAIQYSPTFSDISLDVTVDAHSASIVMTDAGPGLPTTARAVYEHALDSPMLESSMTASPLSSRSLRGIGAYVARGILERLGARVHLLQTGPEGTRLAAEFPRTPSPSLTGT